MGARATPEVSAAEFTAMFESVRTWGRWGAEDHRGALNRQDAKSIMAAARLVRSGHAVSLALPLKTTSGPECPEPAQFRMTQGHDTDAGLGQLTFAKDFVGVDYHN